MNESNTAVYTASYQHSCLNSIIYATLLNNSLNLRALAIRKILFDWSLHNILLFCIKVGFILPVCCYVKLIKQLFVSLLLLFGLNFILIHAKKAITVKDFQSKVKAVTISYIRCWFKTTTHFVYLLTSCICMKQWFSVMSLYISCFNICMLLFNKLRIGINISALSTIILSIRRITLGYVIHLSNIKVSELACMKYLATAV